MWQLDGTIASAEFGKLSLTVSLASGDRKVLVRAGESTLVAELWNLPAIASGPLLDSYVRDDDLVCVVGPGSDFPFYTQLYWTLRDIAGATAPMAAVSLLVSIRTDLLDTHPTIEVETIAPHGKPTTLEIDGGPAFVLPLREQLTLVDFAVPEDCATQTLTETAIERKLFDHFLEKGVIRSGRLFAAIDQQSVNTELAQEYCRQFLAAELPLAT